MLRNAKDVAVVIHGTNVGNGDRNGFVGASRSDVPVAVGMLSD